MLSSRFLKQAQREFRFLVEALSFTEAAADGNRLRFTSADVMIEVTYSERGEVDVVVDENPPTFRFQFRLFLKAHHPAIEQSLGYGIANSEDEIGVELRRLANALKLYGKPILNHDSLVFHRMKTYKWWEHDERVKQS